MHDMIVKCAFMRVLENNELIVNDNVLVNEIRKLIANLSYNSQKKIVFNREK